MTRFGLAAAALAGYVAYRIGRRLVEENSVETREGNPIRKTTGRRKVHRAPLRHIGVDVSARTAG
jgi:hypothetical protein